MSIPGCFTISECRLCESKLLKQILELSPTPAGNNFLTLEQSQEGAEPLFPLELYYCTKCSHVQLGHSVDPEYLFSKEYHFVSGTSNVNRKHFINYAKDLVSEYIVPAKSSVVDIGSNDGTCLAAFKALGMDVLGIDPAFNVAEGANRRGIPTLNSFFDENAVAHIKKHIGDPDVITANNVFAHIRDFKGTISLVKSLMNSKNLFVFEVGYFADVFTNLWFDTIYHEHIDYHTLCPLVRFFSENGMKIVDVKRIDIQGGSLRCYVRLSHTPHQISDNVFRLMDWERSSGFTSLDVYRSFQDRIKDKKNELLQVISNIKNKNLTISGYGAPTKSTTLLCHYEIGSSDLEYIIDDNPLKQNKFTPKTHIPVYSNEILGTGEQPDYLLLLAWNFADSIIEKVKKMGVYEGKFIVPLPNVEIV